MSPGRRRWMLGLLLSAVLGTTGGIGGYTFVYARGASYLSNDPAACANCHVMQDHLDAWVKSTRNGLLHSIAFTSGNFPDPLRIKPLNLRIAEDNCRRCHSELVLEIEHHAGTSASERLECTRCHDEVGHPLR
jgi:cytochrome c nitrite reductase small subunit